MQRAWHAHDEPAAVVVRFSGHPEGCGPLLQGRAQPAWSRAHTQTQVVAVRYSKEAAMPERQFTEEEAKEVGAALKLDWEASTSSSSAGGSKSNSSTAPGTPRPTSPTTI